MLTCGDLAFSLLIDEDLVEVAVALDAPGVVRFLCYDDMTDARWAVSRRWRRDIAGESITLVIRHNGRIAGWTGLLMIDGLPGELQTSTFLHPDSWGSGTNLVAKHVLWTMTELLGLDRLHFMIDARNDRSLAAAWKLFPDASVIWLAAPDEAGVDLLLVTEHGPAAAGALDADQRAQLRALLARHPGWRIWRREERTARADRDEEPVRAARSVIVV